MGRKIFIAVVFLVLATVWIFPPVYRLLLLPMQDFEAIGANLLASKNLRPTQRDSLIVLNYTAEQRIKSFWGEKKANARVVLCSSETQYMQFCQTNGGAGCSISMPFGTWIFIHPDFLSADVIAHELSHAELVKQLGWWSVKRHIPTWFDEGLAVQFDYRFSETPTSPPRYEDLKATVTMISMGNQYVIPLDELATHKQFFGQDATFTELAYYTAATAVAYYWQLQGQKGFRQRLQNIATQKHTFQEAFPPLPTTQVAN